MGEGTLTAMRYGLYCLALGILGLGVADADVAAVQLFLVEVRNGSLGGIHRVKLDEAKATAAVGLTVLEDVSLENLTVLGESLFKLLVVGAP